VNTILCIDTASDRFALGVDRDGKISSIEAEAAHDHSKLLLPAIRDLLGGDPLSAIIVVNGPGAYAGIRVGIATAQGLAFAKGIPLFGIGTLEAAAVASGQDGLVIHSAGRGDFAVQAFQRGRAQGRITTARAEAFGAIHVIGEGASQFLGTDVTPRERCEAALRSRAPSIRKGTLRPGVEAFYLREPNITVSRRQTAGAP